MYTANVMVLSVLYGFMFMPYCVSPDPCMGMRLIHKYNPSIVFNQRTLIQKPFCVLFFKAYSHVTTMLTAAGTLSYHVNVTSVFNSFS